MLSENPTAFGSSGEPGLVRLAAGPVEGWLDPASGFLRHLRWDGVEVLRGVYGAVRDRNWDTVEPCLAGLEVVSSGGGFEVRFEVRCVDAGRGIDFTWNGEVTGSPSGVVRYRFLGVANRPFLKNRIGLCVLHPAPGCPGSRCWVEHGDGSLTAGGFPRAISPHQPFLDIVAITHEVGPGRRVEVRFGGEVFEMEDQRNWTDASFKTYSTPLAEPFPVEVAAGDEIVHTVTVTPVAERARPGREVSGAGAGPAPLSVAVAWDAPRPRPPVGFVIGPDGGDAGGPSPGVVALLDRIRPDHLRVDLDLTGGRAGWCRRLDSAAAVASGCGAGLHAALQLDGGDPDAWGDQLGEARGALDGACAAGCKIQLVFIFARGAKSTPHALAALAAERLPGTTLAAGTDAYFAELNRERPDAGSPCLPCFSVNPQVHAFDDLSLVETLQAQPSAVESALGFSRGPVAVSPITLLPRFNPNATGPAGAGEPGADPRQATPFAAAWALGSLAGLLPCPGVHSLTYFETHGSRGVGDGAGAPYPAAEVFAALAGASQVFATRVSHPLEFAALATATPGGERRLHLASFLSEPLTVAVPGPAGTRTVELHPSAITAIAPDP